MMGPIVTQSPFKLLLRLGALASILLAQLSHAQHGGVLSKRETALIPLLEHHATTLDIVKFMHDPVLHQTHSTTRYVNPKKQAPLNVVFEKRNPEQGKDAIIISSADMLFAVPHPRGTKKRQFVLLRKSPNAVPIMRDNVPYFASFVYVRDVYVNDTVKPTELIDLLGVPSVPEWDIWEQRTRKFYPGWTNCEMTMLFTCASIKAMAEDAMVHIIKEQRRRKRNAELGIIEPTPEELAKKKKRSVDCEIDHEGASLDRQKRQAKPPPPPQLIPIQGEPGHDPGDINDLYLDFDLHRLEDLLKKHDDKMALEAKVRRRREIILRRLKRYGWPDAKGEEGAGQMGRGMAPGGGGGGGGGAGGGAGGGSGGGMKASFNLGGMLGGGKGGGGGGLFGGLLGGGKGGAGGKGGGGGGLGGIFKGLGGFLGGGKDGKDGGKGGGGGPLGFLGGLLGGGKDGGGGPLGMITGVLGGLTGGLLGGKDGGGPLSMITDVVGGLTGGLLGGGQGGGGPLSMITDVIGGLTGGLLGGGQGGGGPLGMITDVIGGLTGGLLGGGGGGGPLSIIGDVVGGLTGGLLGGEGGGGIGGLIGSLVGGKDGPLAAVGGLVSGVLGPDGPLGSILGVAGNLLGGVTDGIAGLAGGLADTLIGTVAGEGGIADMIGGVLGGLTGGPDGPLGALSGLLGPAASLLNPFIDIVGSAGNLIRELPGLGLGLAHGVMDALSPIADAVGIGALVDSLGLGGVLDTASGIVDSILSTGEKVLSAWDSIGNSLIDGAATALTKIGLPPEFAKLAAVATQVAFNSVSLVGKGFWLGWRAGIDAIGSGLNGGRYQGQGFGPDGVKPNTNQIYGILCPGQPKDFFFPQGAVLRAVFRHEQHGELGGFFEPQVHPQDSAFYADATDDNESKYYDKLGRLIPEGFKPPQGAVDVGIVGKLEAGNKFDPESTCANAVFHKNDPEWKDKVWMPPETERKAPERPSKTPDGKTILYGYLMQGIEQSPHIFIAEGDTLSGFFTAEDEDHPEIMETPHGILTPSHPAGHAVFAAELAAEVENIKEVKGVFMPDALNAAGGISGRLSRCVEGNEDSVRFSFVLDKPATEFMFIQGTPEAENVWNVYLSEDEWKYVPPPIPPVPDAPPPKKKKKGGDGLLGSLGLGGKAEPEEVKQEQGLKVTTKQSTAFIPLKFPIEGVLLAIDTKNPAATAKNAMVAKATADGTDGTLKVTVVTKADPTAPKLTITWPSVGIFVPMGFAKSDGIPGALTLDDKEKSGQLKLAKFENHIWTPDQQIWLPQGFGGVSARAGGSINASSAGVPGVASEPVDAPIKPRSFKFGRMFSGSADMTATNINELPHEYTKGHYFKDPKSPKPVFVPNGGVAGVFAPDDASKPEEGKFFPANEKAGSPAQFIFTNPANSLKDGTPGKFVAISKDGKPMEGFFSASLGPDTLVVPPEVEVMAGSEQTKVKEVKQEELSPEAKAKLTPDHKQPKKPPLKYALVDVGGGFKGVIAEGAESLDDPNNPIFQQYVQYRAQHDGDVNPWGEVHVVDPIERQPAEAQAGASVTASASISLDVGGIFGGIFQLGLGIINTIVNIVGGIVNSVLGGFSFLNWEFPQVSEMNNKVKIEPNKIGDQENVANMMDFRMFLMSKYSCKRAQIDGKWIRLFAPLGAEQFLKLKSHAKPKPEYLAAIKASGDAMVIPKKEGIAGSFSAQFELDINAVSPFSRPAGTGVPNMPTEKAKTRNKATGDWKTSAPFDEWGDEHACDEIELDPFAASQAVASMGSSGVTGVDLGMEMTAGVGVNIQYPKVAQKLLTNIEKKRAEKKAEGHGSGSLTTDLLGGLNAKVQATTGAVNDANQKASAGGGATMPKGRGFGGMGPPAGPPSGPPSGPGPKGRTFGEEPVNLRDHAQSLPGWKTQFRAMMPNATLVDDGLIFYGLGNCEQTSVPKIDLLMSGKAQEMLKYYMQILRIDCMEDATKRITDLFNAGYIVLGEGNSYFDIPTSNTHVLLRRMLPAGIKKLSLAFEFHAFTKTYMNLRTKDKFQTSGILREEFSNITRSVGFLTEFSMFSITRARKLSPTHSVRLTRNLLSTLRSVMTKLQQDANKLQECPACTFDKMVTEGDKFRIMSLVQFIIHGLGPFDKGQMPLRASFHSFVRINKEAIAQRVAEFERQFPKLKKA